MFLYNIEIYVQHALNLTTMYTHIYIHIYKGADRSDKKKRKKA